MKNEENNTQAAQQQNAQAGNQGQPVIDYINAGYQVSQEPGSALVGIGSDGQRIKMTGFGDPMFIRQMLLVTMRQDVTFANIVVGAALDYEQMKHPDVKPRGLQADQKPPIQGLDQVQEPATNEPAAE